MQKAAEPAPESALQAESPGEAVPPADAGSPLTLGTSNGGTVNPEDTVAAENGSGAVMDVNNGIVETNNGFRAFLLPERPMRHVGVGPAYFPHLSPDFQKTVALFPFSLYNMIQSRNMIFLCRRQSLW